jgi:uncharacterized membrane protein
MANYSNAFSPSFKTNTFTTSELPGINYGFASKLNLSNIKFDKVNELDFNPIAFDPNINILRDAGWSFITAPENVSWDVANQATRVDIFGTNSPPVVAGTRGMRDLSLGNSLVEGFVRGVTVEGKIAALENLMNYDLNPTDGFVSVPVYQVTANDKVYGNGFFIIKDIKIQEKMRDLKGNTTRALVDISLMEVPEYQVNSGRDQASKVAASAKSFLGTRAPTGAATGATTGAKSGTLGAGQSGAKAGANSATSTSKSKTSAVNAASTAPPTPGNVPLTFRQAP